MEQALTIEEIEYKFGQNIKLLRLLKNIDQQTLCDRAGISLNALKNLENGNGSTLKTLISALRALERVGWLDTLAPLVSVDPMTMVRNKPKRERASRRKVANEKDKK